MIDDLVCAIKESGEKMLEEKNQLMQEFMSLCAVMIQKHWRSFKTRKYIVPFIMKKKQSSDIILSLVQGWKVRRILFGCKEVLQIKKELKELETRNQKF